MLDNLACAHASQNHRSGHRTETRSAQGKSYAAWWEANRLVHDSLTTRDWQDQYCFCHRGYDWHAWTFNAPSTSKNACKRSQRKLLMVTYSDDPSLGQDQADFLAFIESGSRSGATTENLFFSVTSLAPQSVQIFELNLDQRTGQRSDPVGTERS